MHEFLHTGLREVFEEPILKFFCNGILMFGHLRCVSEMPDVIPAIQLSLAADGKFHLPLLEPGRIHYATEGPVIAASCAQAGAFV
jgi:hypothetical protein